MTPNIKISGFADEISEDFEKQLQTVTALGMHAISLRSAYGKSIADYTVNEVEERLLPCLQEYAVEVSSIGSPIGKVDLCDDEGFQRQKEQLDELCRIAKLLNCRYIRVFSFFLPEEESPESYSGNVVEKLSEFVRIAEAQEVILLHENEKGIFGDTGARCSFLLESIKSPNLAVAFDFANFVQCGEDPEICWSLLQPYIKYIHIKDALYESGVNVVCGTGDGKVAVLLKQALYDENYQGFLTLEPHLVQFDALKSLERGKAEVIAKNTAKNGEEGYCMQYQGLQKILEEIEPKRLRIGIIGTGNQGNAYASLLTQRADDPEWPLPPCPAHCCLGALCDNDPKRLEFLKKKYPDIPLYTDWKKLVDSDDVDMVITTVPHYLHTEIAIYCLEHGRNVLVEKPAGVYAKEVKSMNDCAKKHPDTAFGIMFNQRTNTLYQKIKAVIESKELGEIRRSNWIINTWWRPDCYYRQSDWRATWGGEGGGVLVNQAPHQLDLWQWLCGVPTKVYAKCMFGAHRKIAVENDVTIVTEYENGATGCFITTTHDPVGTDRLEIDMDGGKIVVDNSKTATILRFSMTEDEMNHQMDAEQVQQLTQGVSTGSLYTTETIEAESGWGSQHAAVMENFALHVLENAALLAQGTDGILGVNLQNAALLSSWLGREVENPVDEELYLEKLNEHIREEGVFPERK
ncbi:MAG: TIM barrel protein [Lachnospiraceae bacterium]|nr:TIM barrel protein [Lachnospiraceae bacterium]